MVGGFLGAGKTTAMLRLAEHMVGAGRRVGLITNDQSHGLVDTSLLASKGYATAEITGGCFCCRFNSLTSAARTLTRDARPDVFLAEPVGSCTDLRATVQYPLRRLYGGDYHVAPLSVLVDPIRAARVLGLEPGRSFSPKVTYIYEKQLEEADIIVINKRDLLTDEQRQALEDALRARVPHADVVAISARTGANLHQWFDRLGTPMPARASMDVDYDLYAEGEALLGWLNATAQLSSARPFDGNILLRGLATRLQGQLAADHIEIAHLKMTLAPDTGDDLAVLNLVGTDGRLDSPFLLAEELTKGSLILNLRAQGDPDRLKHVVDAALGDVTRDNDVTVAVEHIDSFRPGRPVPTHRMAAL
jgi:Ni2+-binding GTPase involved in maturation of urease and hydrogenase